jgi:acyl carrier protein
MTLPETATLRENLKRLIVESLRLDGLTTDKIADDTPLFGEELGLDSVDALELVVALEKEYGIKIKSHEVDKNVFGSVATLADFVERSLSASGSIRDGK